MTFVLKILASAIIISFVSWLSGKKTGLAGFLTALPLTTLIALAFSQIEWRDSAQSVEYAKSIFIAIPISLTFFLPFLFAKKFELGFWNCYGLGILFLFCGYFIHSSFITFINSQNL
ncbi:MAG: hypothetical protein CME62_12220 [Halobacteriovoraceae bacterium]|nr:hypothetical protein [Halobacteriovoraceae bacterium]|tara:strand:- start:2731 stop:3081 length:351 start_codon:yes stop_codon:yes gene_type:complete